MWLGADLMHRSSVHATPAILSLVRPTHLNDQVFFPGLMTTQDNGDLRIDLSLSPPDLRILLDAVSYRLERWPGGEPHEQESLQTMQTLLQAAILEANFGLTGDR